MTAEKKTEQLHIRVRPSVMERLRRAAEVSGRSIASILRQGGQDLADDLIDKHERATADD
ncbi:MAG: hypothetical protein AAGE52_01380 [Myxococcota bacterium]